MSFKLVSFFTFIFAVLLPRVGVSNFVAMATRVNRDRICLASFNSTIAKNPY